MRHREVMTTPASVLVLLSEARIREEVDRIAAAANARAVHASPAVAPNRRTWVSVRAVILDADGAQRCRVAGLPRRSDVFFVVAEQVDAEPPAADVLAAAIEIGARCVLVLPCQSDELVRALSAIADTVGQSAGGGAVAAVVGGRGGAGASIFSAALALSATSSLLIDLDPWGGGIDLLVGGENGGLRWPDVEVRDGRLSWAAVRDALPRHRGVSVLSGSRRGQDIARGAVDAVVDAGRIGGVTVVCDLPRQLTAVTRPVIDGADLVVVVAPCDVRSCASTTATASALAGINPNVGLVVRGPSPGGLRAGEFADMAGFPLLAAMRPEPMVSEKLEHGGLVLRGRSPLAAAARRILAVLGGSPARKRERVA